MGLELTHSDSVHIKNNIYVIGVPFYAPKNGIVETASGKLQMSVPVPSLFSLWYDRVLTILLRNW